MTELLRSNDPVLVSFVVSLLAEAAMPHTVADSHMSMIEGSINAFQRRILVAEDRYPEAFQLLSDAGVSLEYH